MIFLLSTDCSGILDFVAVEQLQEGLLRALRTLVNRRRPDDNSLFPKLLLRLPDLRTLNNLHSDKLLAFRIDPWAISRCSWNSTKGHDWPIREHLSWLRERLLILGGDVERVPIGTTGYDAC